MDQGARTDTAKGEVAVREPSRTQGLLARRVAESRAIVPDQVLTTAVDLEAAAELLAGLDGPSAPTLTDLALRAIGVALRRHPFANGAYRDARFETYARVNVGLLVWTEDDQVAPTIFDADATPLAEIAARVRDLTARAVAREITQPELSGATSTLADLGPLGVDRFAAVVQPPHATAFALGAAAPRAVARDGAVVVRRTADLTLTVDHRILYGARAAALLTAVRELLEAPAALTG